MTDTTMTTTETPTTTPTPEVTVQTATGPVKALALLPKYAATPKRGAPRKDRREAVALYQYAVTQGGVVTLTPEALSSLQSLGLQAHRVTNAAYKLRKYYGVPVTAQRTGRKVTAYQVTL